MSKIDESPILRFERAYDTNTPRQLINVEWSIQVRLSNQVRCQQVPIEDGVARERVAGLLSNIFHWNCTSVKLNWTEGEWHEKLLLVTLGNVNGVIERVLDSDSFREDANRTNENRKRFIHKAVGDLAGNQQEVRGVVLEHIKRDISYMDPDDILARARDI